MTRVTTPARHRSAITGLLLASLAATATPATAAPAADGGRFSPMEATIDEIHAAFASGDLTCTELVTDYLERIAAYDAQGPTLRSVATVNPAALQTAAEMDAAYAQDPDAVGPLHCIPILLKDNFNTADMPTSSGSLALKDMVPAEDAFVVAKMRAAGGLVLAKMHMQEFARGGTSESSLGGQVLNPYALTRTPGGSSGGTAAGIAANFGVLGTGSDTGQSIRSPASANSLVGVRPTRGLIGRTGVAPNSFTQDEIGPITRTVRDAAHLLDVMVGYDPDDPVSAYGRGRTPASYTDGLDEDALDGVRLGLMTNMLGTDPAVHGEVNEVVAEAVAVMESLGAEVVEFTMEGYDELAGDVATSSWEAAPAMRAYLERVGPNAPVSSLEDIIATGTAVPSVQQSLIAEVQAQEEGGMQSLEYLRRTANRDRLTTAAMSAMAEHDLDAIVYPHQKRLVALVGEPQLDRNGTLSNGTGLPAVTFPGGFSAPTDEAPVGVPVGLEILGPSFSEPQLLAYAYAFEQATQLRVPPPSVPAIEYPATPVDFADVGDGHPFYPDIRWMAEAGLAEGSTVGDEVLFYPTAAVSRQAMAAFLYRYAGEGAQPQPGPGTFPDVDPESPFYAAIEWMAAEGLAGGYDDGTFGPNQPVSRAATATFLHRLAGEPAAAPGSFTDVPTDSTFAVAVGWAQNAGVTQGYADGYFGATLPVSRQAMAAFLHRYDDFLTRAGVVVG